MLTLEQIAEGRAIIAAGHSYTSWQDGADFFRAHADALLDAAERVARQEAERDALRGPRQGWEAFDEVVEAAPLIEATQRRADAERGRAAREADEKRDAKALQRLLQDIRPVLSRVISLAPIATARGVHLTNPHAWTLERIEAWLLERGVRATVEMVGSELTFVRAALVDYWHPRCPECAGDLGGVSLGRLENHKPDCSRFPL